jgi:isoleucyl-tRNA synthetase
VAPAAALIESALRTNKEYICQETQALSLEFEEGITDAVELDIDNQKLQVKIDV